MKALNIITTIVAVLLLAVPLASADAYSGYNTIGNYQQYQYTYQGSYQGSYSTGPVFGGQLTLPNPYYTYPTTPRAGGSFANWYITGLRTPTYYTITPTHYSSFYRPYGGYSYGGYGRYTGGFGGFDGTTAPVRVRYGVGI